MSHYLVAIQLPDDFDPSLQTEATIRDITALNEELEAAGARILALASPRPATQNRCGRSPKCARSLEVVGGYCVIE